MAELAKIRRVITKQVPDAPHETLLTVDATTGQNGLRQAKLFSETVPVSGLVLTKLDGTAKGGIALAIAHELGIPVKLIGVGEKLEDLRPFDAVRVRARARELIAAGYKPPQSSLGPVLASHSAKALHSSVSGRVGRRTEGREQWAQKRCLRSGIRRCRRCWRLSGRRRGQPSS